MTGALPRVAAGRVGRPHGLDGSFHLEPLGERLLEGVSVTVAGRASVVERLAGTNSHPIVRLQGIEGRAAAERLRGELLLISQEADQLAAGEYFSADLVGCDVPGLGRVRRVIAAPSCDLLEVAAGEREVLVPLISDAVTRVDTTARLIEINRAFLGLGER